ncbi:MAG: hypothetical protein GF307_12620 [candidate division Zixibacteria bacterium]|nr:hypothetical protein [candidate division Zixibacteria bacterium]
MNKILMALLGVILIVSLAQNADAQCGRQRLPAMSQLDFEPELDIIIPHQFPKGGHSVSIASDGEYYYLARMGNPENGSILVYDLEGNFERMIPVELDMRAIFYHLLEEQLFIKDNSLNLYYVNLSTGEVSLYLEDVFHHADSKVAFNLGCCNLLYEMCGDTVYVGTLEQPLSWEYFTGIRHGTDGSENAIGCNNQYFFTWDGSQIFAYSHGGFLEDSLTVSYGDYGWSLDYANGRLWLANDADSGTGYWYGYTGIAPAEPCLSCRTRVLTPYVPTINGNIIFDLAVINCGSTAMELHAEFFPGIGPMNAGTVFDFDLTKLLDAEFNAYEVHRGRYYFHVHDISHLNITQAFYQIEAGPGIDDYLCLT